VTGTPNHRLARQKRHCASFMGALRGKCVQLIPGLQDQNALATHRDDDELVLLELCYFIAGQMRRSSRPGLRERFEITNYRVRDADQPTDQTRAQQQIEKTAARRCCCRSGPGQSVHCPLFLCARKKRFKLYSRCHLNSLLQLSTSAAYGLEEYLTRCGTWPQCGAQWECRVPSRSRQSRGRSKARCRSRA
jgi:hypothetical protein